MLRLERRERKMMKKITFVKKLKLTPVGDKDEMSRVYDFIRGGQYTQYQLLNMFMSELGTLYYKCNRDFKCPEFLEGKKEIFARKNPQWDSAEYPMPKGIGMQSTVGQKVQQDFSTALRNGLAKGERHLPFYKRSFPLMTKGSQLQFHSVKNDSGKTEYRIKWVNKCEFSVILGSRGKYDYTLHELLERLCEHNENYHVAQSSITIKDKKIILNLTVQKMVDEEEYAPVSGRVMGVAMGYNKPCVAALSDSDKQYTIGSEINYIQKRQYQQARRQVLQSSLKECKGGKGRSRKLAAMNRLKEQEKNCVQYFNHCYSKEIVELAKNLRCEAIVMEKIHKEDLDSVLLRNWSFYQLIQYVTYKANAVGIKVIEAESDVILTEKDDNSKEKHRKVVCAECGCVNDALPKMFEWTQDVSFTCDECHTTCSLAYNKAKFIAHHG